MEIEAQWQKVLAAALKAQAQDRLKAAGHHYAEALSLAWRLGPEAMDETLTKISAVVQAWTVQDAGGDGLISLGKRLLVILEQVPDDLLRPVARYRRGEVLTLAYAVGLLGLIRSAAQPADELERLRPLALAHADTFDQLTDSRWQLRACIDEAFRRLDQSG